MAAEKEPKNENSDKESAKSPVSTQRRSLIKALAGIPVLQYLRDASIQKFPELIFLSF